MCAKLKKKQTHIYLHVHTFCTTYMHLQTKFKPRNIIGKSSINIIIEPEGVQQKQMDSCNFKLQSKIKVFLKKINVNTPPPPFQSMSAATARVLWGFSLFVQFLFCYFFCCICLACREWMGTVAIYQIDCNISSLNRENSSCCALEIVRVQNRHVNILMVGKNCNKITIISCSAIFCEYNLHF